MLRVMDTTEGKAAFELCLDFSNTVDWRNGKSGKVAEDSIKDYGNLVGWSGQHGLIGSQEAKRLGRLAGESGKDRSTLRRAVELRETIYRIFSAVAHGRNPEDSDLQALNEFLSASQARPRIARVGERFQWAWQDDEATPNKMLWPITKSAADLLTSDQLGNVRECANEDEGCGWLFLDDTKNHSRRWCNMETCGNKAKAKRYYEKHRKESA